MVAPVCNYWQRYGGRTEQFPSLPYRLARLKLELNASCNTESMSWTNFGGSIVTWILYEGANCRLFCSIVSSLRGRLFDTQKIDLRLSFAFRKYSLLAQEENYFDYGASFPLYIFCWRTLLDFFSIALAFQSDLTGEIDSITTRLSLSSLLWYNCLYCWTSSSHLLHLGVFLPLCLSVSVFLSLCASLYSSPASVKLIRESYSFSVWPSVNTTP